MDARRQQRMAAENAARKGHDVSETRRATYQRVITHAQDLLRDIEDRLQACSEGEESRRKRGFMDYRDAAHQIKQAIEHLHDASGYIEPIAEDE